MKLFVFLSIFLQLTDCSIYSALFEQTTVSLNRQPVEEISRSLEFSKSITFPSGERFTCSTPTDSSDQPMDESLARAAAIYGRCKSINEDRSRIDLCSGIGAVVYEGNELIVGIPSISVEFDQDAGIIREYFEGTDDLKLIVEWTCSGSGYTTELVDEKFIAKIHSELACAQPSPEKLLEEVVGDLCMTHTPASSSKPRQVNMCFPTGILQIPEDSKTYSLGTIPGNFSASFQYVTPEEVVDSVDEALNVETFSESFSSTHLRVPAVDGSFCFTTGKPRSSEIWFGCPPNFLEISEEDVGIPKIVAVLEPEVCEYRVVVESRAFCSDSRLRWKKRKSATVVECHLAP